MKKLFILVNNGGDGSYHPQYTMNPELIAKLQRADDEGLMDCEDGIGVDGDGFHYDSINLPDECTPESLGIHYMLEDDCADEYFK